MRSHQNPAIKHVWATVALAGTGPKGWWGPRPLLVFLKITPPFYTFFYKKKKKKSILCNIITHIFCIIVLY
jgi:hypothetical protein